MTQKWNKFGEAMADGAGVNKSTTQIADEVHLSLTSNREVCLTNVFSVLSLPLYCCFSVSRAARR